MTAYPKPRPHLLEKRDRAADVARIDRLESAKVKARSGGRCEVTEVAPPTWVSRCPRRAAPGNHHLIGGSGRRNRGRSILAEHRLAVCQPCHNDITGRVLCPLGGPHERESAATVLFERAR